MSKRPGLSRLQNLPKRHRIGPSQSFVTGREDARTQSRIPVTVSSQMSTNTTPEVDSLAQSSGLQEYPMAVRIPGEFGATTEPAEGRLASVLSEALYSHIHDARRRGRWGNLRPSKECCVLVSCIYKAKTGPVLEWACDTCSRKKRGGNDGRPCAILDKVEGVATIVFLPLKEAQSAGRHSDEVGFWIAGR
jgi:hypothetical protein